MVQPTGNRGKASPSSLPSSPPVLLLPSFPFSAYTHIRQWNAFHFSSHLTSSQRPRPSGPDLPSRSSLPSGVPDKRRIRRAMPVQLGRGEKLADLSPTAVADKGRASSARKNRRQKKKAVPMQSLFDTSKEIFSASSPGFVPPPDAVARLSALLNDLKPHDVGIDSSMPCFKHGDSKGPPRVTYLHFYDCSKFSFGIFCLPKSAVIPLHNHPGMTVFSKILFGSMHLKSYDWATSLPDSNSSTLETSDGARLAKVNTNAVFDASAETIVLYPENGGNLHCFTALTPCAVLDVMAPPYNSADGRDCAYYSEAPYSSSCGSDDQYSWLKEIPSTFEMKGTQMVRKFIV